jgi:hypothetical protein
MAVTGMLCLGLVIAEQEALADSAGEVQLVGMVGEEMFLGPPGFGESPKTDQKITIPVLKVIRSSAWPPDSNGNPLKPGDKVEMVKFDLPMQREYAGKCVTVSGTLEKRTMASEYSPLVIFVSGIAASSACR